MPVVLAPLILFLWSTPSLDLPALKPDVTSVFQTSKLGALQVQSNALAALEAIDPAVAEAVLREGCITGDRINGLCDGETGDW